MGKKNKLIEARKNKDYSQECMADFLKISTSSYCRKENGILKIANYEWKKLAEYLEVSIEDIYEADENMIFIFNCLSTISKFIEY